MDNKDILNKIEELKTNYLLEINSWTTIGDLANKSGTIITTEKKVYSYTIFFKSEIKLQINVNSFIEEYPPLTDYQYNQLLNFIKEENLLDKTFEEENIKDAGFTIAIKQNEKERIINNCISLDEKNPKIYEKLLIFIKNNLL